MQSILPLHQQYCEYSLTFKGLSKRTLKNEYYVFKQFVSHTNLNHPDQITKSIIERYITEKKVYQNWSAKTIKNTLQAFNNFFKFYVSQGYGNINPVEDIPKPRIPKRLPKYIPKEDALKLIEWTYVAKFRYTFERIRARAIISTFLFTGVRQGELLSLKVSDIMLDEKVLRVENGKGGKDRLIPLNARLIGILQEYLQERQKRKKMSMYFFTSLRFDKQMSQSVIKRLFIKLQKDLGFKVYPHLLRHTFATLMLQGGCGIYSLSKMMGHGDIKTTTIYLSLTTGHLNEQINKHPLSFTPIQPLKKIF
ncbi:tyrosine-type recombinase/integrase [Tenacibaculum agarivorans]|uniref:tyrosine-type recombinase/integrase n=1 Tax=Tenacibaculum agarivorans TaxID=1908389 RepID=UPI00094B9711|nr:tyrosine-type recombinase/integrase [Tenacibaculum agarivorans]